MKIAHISNDKKRTEPLSEHLDKCVKYAQKLLKGNLKEKSGTLKKIVLDAVRYHDYGKLNKDFQKKIKGDEDIIYSNHSLPSAAYFIEKYLKLYDYKIYDDLIISLAYLISKHHSNLGILDIPNFFITEKNINIRDYLKQEDFYKMYDILNKYKENFPDLDFSILENYLFLKQRKGFSFFSNLPDMYAFIFIKFVFSLIISADYYATFDFFQEKEINDFGRITDNKKFFSKFNEAYQAKLNQKEKTKLNQIRTDLSIKALNNFLKSDKRIFFLNAPTGAGKTLMSLNLAAHSNVEKIFYVFPYNTIAEQMADDLKEFFNKEDYRVINSVTGVDYKNDKVKNNEKITNEEMLLNVDMMHYPIIITSSVKMFDIFFGNSKTSNFNFWQLQNSLIIFDEVQTIPPELIKNFMRFIDFLTDFLNCKVILMSATLPRSIFEKYIDNKKIEILLDEETLFIDEFRNRVEIYKFNQIFDNFYDLANVVIKNIENKNKVLIEFISKEKSLKFYEILKNYEELKDYEILLIRGDTNKIHRKKIIDKCKENNKKVILVSTQVVEAGVDIDMDIGFKQISLLESEEQFLGRINRNAKKEGSKAYFFDILLEDEKINDFKRVYGKENIKVRSYLTLFNEEIFNILKKKDISKYYKKLKNEIELSNIEFKSPKMSFGSDKRINFYEINNEMKLIKTETFGIFIPFVLELDEKDVESLKKYKKFIKGLNNKKIINGEDVLNFYIKTKTDKNLTFNDKKVKLYWLKEIMDIFTFNVYQKDLELIELNGYMDQELSEKSKIFVINKIMIDKIYDKDAKILRKINDDYFVD